MAISFQKCYKFGISRVWWMCIFVSNLAPVCSLLPPLVCCLFISLSGSNHRQQYLHVSLFHSCVFSSYYLLISSSFFFFCVCVWLVQCVARNRPSANVNNALFIPSLLSGPRQVLLLVFPFLVLYVCLYKGSVSFLFILILWPSRNEIFFFSPLSSLDCEMIGRRQRRRWFALMLTWLVFFSNFFFFFLHVNFYNVALD